MNVYDVILKRRSIRRFKQEKIPIDTLELLINSARIAASAANLQPLEYILINDPDVLQKVFPTISWAGYIKPVWIPNEHERPTAYIAILVTQPNNPFYLRDVGIASAHISITAESTDIGSCILCKINRNKLVEILDIPEDVVLDSIIALGYKGENPILENTDETVKYWRDKENVLHVPKRTLKKLIHYNTY